MHRLPGFNTPAYISNRSFLAFLRLDSLVNAERDMHRNPPPRRILASAAQQVVHHEQPKTRSGGVAATGLTVAAHAVHAPHASCLNSLAQLAREAQAVAIGRLEL